MLAASNVSLEVFASDQVSNGLKGAPSAAYGPFFEVET